MRPPNLLALPSSLTMMEFKIKYVLPTLLLHPTISMYKILIPKILSKRMNGQIAKGKRRAMSTIKSHYLNFSTLLLVMKTRKT